MNEVTTQTFERSKQTISEKIVQLNEEMIKGQIRDLVRGSVEETLTYCDLPGEHWTRIRTNNVIERLNREIRRRTRVMGTFPDGNSALMPVCARLRRWGGPGGAARNT